MQERNNHKSCLEFLFECGRYTLLYELLENNHIFLAQMFLFGFVERLKITIKYLQSVSRCSEILVEQVENEKITTSLSNAVIVLFSCETIAK